MEARLNPCVKHWRDSWASALASTKAEGAIKRITDGLDEARRRRQHAYGGGVRIGGKHYDHEWAFKAVADMADKVAANIEKAGSKSGGSPEQVAEWLATLKSTAAEARTEHVALCMEFGTTPRPHSDVAFDSRYVNALAEFPEAKAELVAAQIKAKAEWEVRTRLHRCSLARLPLRCSLSPTHRSYVYTNPDPHTVAIPRGATGEA